MDSTSKSSITSTASLQVSRICFRKRIASAAGHSTSKAFKLTNGSIPIEKSSVRRNSRMHSSTRRADASVTAWMASRDGRLIRFDSIARASGFERSRTMSVIVQTNERIFTPPAIILHRPSGPGNRLPGCSHCRRIPLLPRLIMPHGLKKLPLAPTFYQRKNFELATRPREKKNRATACSGPLTIRIGVRTNRPENVNTCVGRDYRCKSR